MKGCMEDRKGLENNPFGRLDVTTKSLVIETMKACCLYSALLDNFQKQFMTDLTYRYSEYGTKLHISDRQVGLIRQIAERLNIK